jgi:hypothetical protein
VEDDRFCWVAVHSALEQPLPETRQKARACLVCGRLLHVGFTVRQSHAGNPSR